MATPANQLANTKMAKTVNLLDIELRFDAVVAENPPQHVA